MFRVTCDDWLLSKDFSTKSKNCQGTKQLSPVCKKMSMAAISALNATKWIVLSQQRPTQKGSEGHGHASKPAFCSAISVTCDVPVSFNSWWFHLVHGSFYIPKTRRDYEILWGKNPLNQVVSLRSLRFWRLMCFNIFLFLLEHGTRRRAAAGVWRDLPSAAVPNGHPALLRSWRKSWGFQQIVGWLDGWSAYSPWEMGDTGGSKLGGWMGMISPLGYR